MAGRRAVLALAIAAGARPAWASKTYLCFFDRDSAEMVARCQQVVLEFLEFLEFLEAWKAYPWPGWQIDVFGHADRAEPDAMAMGARRAEAIAAFLRLNGVPAEAIRVIDLGTRRPLVPRADTLPESQNRRAELVARPPAEPRAPSLRGLFDPDAGFIPRSW